MIMEIIAWLTFIQSVQNNNKKAVQSKRHQISKVVLLLNPFLLVKEYANFQLSAVESFLSWDKGVLVNGCSSKPHQPLWGNSDQCQLNCWCKSTLLHEGSSGPGRGWDSKCATVTSPILSQSLICPPHSPSPPYSTQPPPCSTASLQPWGGAYFVWQMFVNPPEHGGCYSLPASGMSLLISRNCLQLIIFSLLRVRLPDTNCDRVPILLTII